MHLISALIATLGLSAVSLAAPAATNVPNAPDSVLAKCGGAAHFCDGTNNTDPHFFCGDSRLGPVALPSAIPLGTEFVDYHRLGGLCPGAFLTKWTFPQNGTFMFPPDDGFQLDVNNATIQGTQLLEVGMKLDRYGSEFGRFLSPVDAPYIQRSLPPSSLDTQDQTFPFNYHRYEVTMAFEVSSGPIAAWFGQPGQGTQYELASNSSVMALITAGFLKRLALQPSP